MEKWRILAVDTDYQFKSRNDGKTVHGVRWLMTPLEDKTTGRTRFRGMEWMEQFISDDRVNELPFLPVPGDEIMLIFNRHGSIEDIQLLNMV